MVMLPSKENCESLLVSLPVRMDSKDDLPAPDGPMIVKS